jgi:hypothetical protein
MMDSEDSSFRPTHIYDIMTKSDDQIVEHINRGNEKNNLLNSNDSSNTDSNGQDLEGSKTIYQRFFSTMEAGSLRGSVFAMSSLALGTGCLTLPQKFEQMSLLAAVLVIILAALAAYWSLTLMIKASKKSKQQDYSRLVKVELGNGSALFLDFVVLLYVFGILISYQCISKSF